MNALARALARDTRTYRVPVPWQGLNFIEPLRGGLCVVLAQPGAGKSAFALNWAMNIDSPSLVLSLDTDLTTQAIRAASIASGRSMKVVKRDPKAWSLYLDRVAGRVRVYDLGLNTREINDLVQSEAEFWGAPPALTIVDNVSNFIREGDYNDHRKLFMDLHRVARISDTFVLALHHVTRGAQPGKPLTLTSGQFAGEQEAEIMLGLWSQNEDLLNVSILKNRGGRADPTGNLYVPLRWERENMQIRDLSAQEHTMKVLEGVL